MRANNSQTDSVVVRGKAAFGRLVAAGLTVGLLLLAGNPVASAEDVVLMEDDFESGNLLDDWNLSGDWRFKTNSACLPNGVAYRSPTNALVFDYGSECRYRNSRSGYAAMTYDVQIPITLPSVTLEWWDFAGAELGADFYFVQVSTDSGATWPYEVYRESQDETFWDQETVDLTPFIGQSIRLRFGFQSDETITNYGWYVDDVRIVGEALGAGISAVALADAGIVEGDAGTQPMQFTVSIEPPNALPITLEYATYSGTANAGLDFVATSGPLEIPAGSAEATIEVSIAGDAFFEATETFSLQISNCSENGRITISEAMGIILDNEQLTDIYVEDFEQPEGTFLWTTGYPDNPLDPPDDEVLLSLWHIQSEDPGEGCLPGVNSYTSASHALVFNSPADCSYFTAQGVEGFVRMRSAKRIPPLGVSADNALTAQLSFQHYLDLAGEATAYVEISTDAGNTWTVLKSYSPAGASGNYLLSWEEEVISLGDSYIGEDVMVQFHFLQPPEQYSNQAAGWYIDDFKISYSQRPTGVSKVKIGPASQTEGNFGTSKLSFPVTIVPPNPEPITLSYQTVELSGAAAAAADVDYVNTTAQVVIAAESAAGTLDVLLLGDDQPESANEEFEIQVMNVSPNVFLVNERATGTIEDDDVPSTFSVGLLNTDPLETVLDESDGTVTIAVVLDRARSVPIPIAYRTRNGTALAGPGLDYTAASGSLTFPANTNRMTFPLTILDDTQYDNLGVNETFFVDITTGSPYAAKGSTEFEIVDNETAPAEGACTLTITELTVVPEGSCPTISAADPCDQLYTATFRVKLEEWNGQTITVNYFTEDGTATAGRDYEAVSGTLTIPEEGYSGGGDSVEGQIVVPIWADREIEGDEFFSVILAGPTGNVNVQTNTGVCTISDDDYMSTAFGVNGGVLVKRELLEQELPSEKTLTDAVDFTGVDFKAYEYDKVYGWDGNLLKSVSVVTGIIEEIGDGAISGFGTWTGLAWDHTNGVAYGTTSVGEIYEVDLSAGTGVFRGNTGVRTVAAAVHPTTGRLYTVQVNRGGSDPVAKLYKVVPGGWTTTLIGVLTGVTPSAVDKDAFWSCDFADSTGELYLNAYVAGGLGDVWATRRVDITTGESALAGEEPPVSSLAIATPPPPDSVEWTQDLYYASGAPDGILLQGDGNALPAAAEAGAALSGVGDVNNDTFEDFIVTAWKADVMTPGGALTGAGKAFLFFGGPAGSAETIVTEFSKDDALFGSTLPDDANGVVISGSSSGELLGRSVTGIGDINADGLNDFAIGYVGSESRGGVYLIYGSRDLPAAFSTSSIGDPDQGATVEGVKLIGSDGNDLAGFSVSGAGDFNSDGYNDLLIGAPDAGTGLLAGNGAAYVIFGSAYGIGVNGVLELQSLAPPRGIRILGEQTASGFGTSVSGAGDINGDGIEDIIIGAPGANSSDGYVVFVFGHVDYGTTDSPALLDLARLSDGDPPNTPHSLSFTTAIPAAGGLNDMVNPAIVLPPPYGTSPGAFPGMRISGEGGVFGGSVQGAGDVNGDGMDDAIIGAPQYDGGGGEPHWGRCYVVFGSEGHVAEGTAGNVGVTIPGLLLTGIDAGDNAGVSVAGAGDCNGDGFMDLVIGAPGATPGGFSGEAYVLFGRAGLGGRLSLRDLSEPGVPSPLGKYLYATHGGADYLFGRVVSSAGDFNNDSIADILIGCKNGALLAYGTAVGESGRFKNRMRSGESSLGEMPGGTGTDLDEQVFRAAGQTCEGSFTRASSRVDIEFSGGGFGTELASASTQSVTVYRFPSPDIAVGDEGSEEDDARWTPGGVHWKVVTNRQQFSMSQIDFYYLPSDVEGFDLQNVGIFYAKPNAELSENTVWSWLPFTHDPDRRVFRVTRNHNLATAQEEFNGYYALIQANLVTYLGGAIPSVGVTTENTWQYGPEVVPEGHTFWHTRDKKLYAIKDGELTIRWKNSLGKMVSEVKAINLWPRESSNRYQPFVAGSPSVPLENPDGVIEFEYSKLTAKDSVVVASAADVEQNHLFSGGLTRNANPNDVNGVDDPDLTGRVLIMLGTNAAPEQGDIYFQFVKVLKWKNSTALHGGAAGIPWEIGRYIGTATDSYYAGYHDETAGGPFVLFENAPYAAVSERYPGFYDRSTRTGSIVPVNKKLAGMSDLVLVFYEQGRRLVDAKTGNPARDPQTLAPVDVFTWPHSPARYSLNWPANPNTIVIARQNGSGEIDVATYGPTLDVYVQNDSGLTGFNPNEEHALIASYAAGKAVFALRDDLNTAETSEPYVLMTYYDPNDLTEGGVGRAKMKAFRVTATQGLYEFGPWRDDPGDPASPYEGEAGAFIAAPTPLSTLRYSLDNTYVSGPAWEDRTGRHWAKAEGDIVMRFYYPVLRDFHFPQAYRDKYSDRDFSVGGDDVPWLDGGPSSSRLEPVDVRYRTTWPVDVATMKIGDILVKPKFGLPAIDGQCSVDLIYMESGEARPSAQLIDPVQARSVPLAELPLDIGTAGVGAERTFPDLPPALGFRVSYDVVSQRLKVKGILVEPVAGYDYVLLNVLTQDDVAMLKSLSSDPDWQGAVNALADEASEPIVIHNSTEDLFEMLALSTGNAKGVGYVTLAMQNADVCDPLPVSLEIIKVVADLEPGSIAVVKPPCCFDEKLTLMHTGDFLGKPEDFYFEWLYIEDQNGTMPAPPDPDSPTDPWTAPPLSSPSTGQGVSSITIEGPGLLTLTDNWFAVRYKSMDTSVPWYGQWSNWTPVQLAPGWIKRVVGTINPFTQRASGGGIEGAEQSFASFGTDAPNTLVSMISQAGERWQGSVPLSCENLDGFGLIEIYETVLGRGSDLSINALSPINHPGVNTALLLVASRISDLYMLLGNEAYADASDPTIAFGTDDDVYGQQATSIHAFMNQTSTLLEEELALLRGRDETYAPGIKVPPFYNKLVWNFTDAINGGEVAYALNYDMRDLVDGGDGVISEADAKRLYPQGHGDAWGHYLTAMKVYYKLLAHPYYAWVNRSEAVLVGGQPVTVDYLDERKFAAAAAAKARTGAEIVDLTYRSAYVENPAGQWQGYSDANLERSWGFSDWASRTGQAAYIDWAVGNAILRAEDPDPGDVGVAKIDRTTVQDLADIAAAYNDIQAKTDMADLGLNPLGLGTNVVPFDINPTEIDSGLTHFEQVLTRAIEAVNNAANAFDYASNSTQLLRRQADSEDGLKQNILAKESDFKARLIEIFGYPYTEDIGPGGTYETGYDGPDIYHYMYADDSGIYGDSGIKQVYFAPSDGDASDLPSEAESILAEEIAGVGDVDISTGEITVPVQVEQTISIQILPGFSIDLPVTTLEDVGREIIEVDFNMRASDGRLRLAKPKSWTSQRRAPGELQQSRSALIQELGKFIGAIEDYNTFVNEIQRKTELLEAQFDLSADKVELLTDHKSKKQTLQDWIFGLTITKFGLETAATIVEKVASAISESVPQVTGVIIGFSNGIIIDGLAPVRGGLEGAASVVVEGLKIAANAIDVATLRITQEGERADMQLAIDTAELEGDFANLQALKGLESALENEINCRLAVYNQYEAVVQASGAYLKTLAEGERLLQARDVFRKQVSADVQMQRYKDMAFRIFRNEALQKYRAQFDLAARYTYLAAKAYDYETTLLSEDTLAGQRFLTNIVRERQVGSIVWSVPQVGKGLGDALAVMQRNFEVLEPQLGFNNPQVETNRFSLRQEKFRVLPGEEGDEAWRTVLNQDYAMYGAGRVANLWDVPEFSRLCVPPSGFGSVEPGLVIPFTTTIEEGKNFFGHDAGGQDSSYDSTQFATKIRSVGVWFSNYDYLGLSNTPRVWLVPAGTDVLRSPTDALGHLREFNVLDQLLPVPFPITTTDLEDPAWIPSVDSLSGEFLSIRRFGRFRAYHDSGDFDVAEMQRDSRLIGRSVWNTQWMLIIPASTLSSDREEGLERFINGRLVNGTRDGNGVSDIKLFFETYAYPRVKK